MVILSGIILVIRLASATGNPSTLATSLTAAFAFNVINVTIYDASQESVYYSGQDENVAYVIKDYTQM